MDLRKFYKYENGLLVMLFLANGLMFFDRLAFNFLAPFFRGEFQLTNLHIGLLNSALGVAWAFSGFMLSGFIDRKANKRLILVISIVLFSVCSIITGLATSFITLLLARIIMGLAEGPVLPTTQALMVVESSPNRIGFNMGFIQAVAAGVFGQILTPILLIPVAEAFGWRTAFYFAGIPGILLAIFLWVKLREPTLARFEMLKSHMKAKNEEIVESNNFKSIWTKNLILCVIIASLMITTFFSVLIFAPLYLVENRGFTPAQMGMFMTALGVSSVVGGFGITALSDRFGRVPMIFISLVLVAFAPLVVFSLQATIPVLCLAIFAFWLGAGCLSILLATVPSESVVGSYAGRAIAVVVGISEIIGGCLSPVLAGFLADHVRPEAPFILGFSAAVIAAIFSIFLTETAPVKVGNLNALKNVIE